MLGLALILKFDFEILWTSTWLWECTYIITLNGTNQTISAGVIVGMYGNRLTTADIRSITGSAREALVEVSFKIDNISLLIEPYDPSFPGTHTLHIWY